MTNSEPGLLPVLLHAEPVLAVKNISETISYWQKKLGFPHQWTWGEPANHGGVSWNNVFVQFSLDPEMASASEGHSVWIKVERLETLYDLHQKKGADIVTPLQNRPWGMADYTVREMNGYYLIFSAPVTDREPRQVLPPSQVRVHARQPTPQQYRHLVTAVGWSSSSDEQTVKAILAASLFAVVAEDCDTGKIIGCAMVLGDGISFYYVKDVMVEPVWQGKRVGTAMMKELTKWLDEHAPDNSLVGLFTGEGLTPFYQQFGFTTAFGMHRRIHKEG
ncbi:MAG TPA: GNAT family N-acetyltransferase [Chitinophagaceae bacterium]|nr:GNAT family N-acetyltransferase [Chitinophagaceae bacterium]